MDTWKFGRGTAALGVSARDTANSVTESLAQLAGHANHLALSNGRSVLFADSASTRERLFVTRRYSVGLEEETLQNKQKTRETARKVRAPFVTALLPFVPTPRYTLV